MQTGRHGRPRKVPNLNYLYDAMSPKRRITLTSLAKLIGIHRHTLRTYLKHYNVDYKFAVLSDSDLDLLVKTFRSVKPESGIQYLVGFLRRHGVRIQKSRLISSVHRVDQLGRVLRERTAIRRRKYKVSRPNALWHMDGHHKLILWGIVIHGFIDGYCRTVSALLFSVPTTILLIGDNVFQVTGLRASTNNRASTVLEVFIEAVRDYGLPSRGRGDRGGENKDVSVFLILARGPNRASFMWGSYVPLFSLILLMLMFLHLAPLETPELSSSGSKLVHSLLADGGPFSSASSASMD